MGGGGGVRITDKDGKNRTKKGGYDRDEGEMSGKMIHKGAVADEQTKLHEVKGESL